jgi:NAD(P)-dependent dehydrogenase (short-subunit alcohol dehydrogenase family)
MNEDPDQVVIVTGGSRGIGAAVAKLAARDGWAVAVNYLRDRVSADEVVAEIVRWGGRAVACPANVAVEAEVQRLFADVGARLGPVRGLVNNAGILRPRTFATDISLTRWTEIFATNVLGTFLCAREAARIMSTRLGGSGGAIVNLSSMAAVHGAPADAVDYAASKGAIDTLTIGLGRELASEGIRVNAIRPGLIDTEMQIDSGDPERARRLAPTVPMRRVGTVEEIAEAVVWLLSDKASYCTGAILTVSGGR